MATKKTDRRTSPETAFLTAGRKKDTINVLISYRIIELFSEGLYSSPHKAIEELVSNSFDAGATHVHVVLPPDLQARESTIAVIDDGEGMSQEGFEQHWLIGVSNKRNKSYVPPRGRKQIGRFGIGKLATYVLANRLSHVSKHEGKYLSLSMDYSRVPAGDKSVATKNPVKLELRELTEAEARSALAPWIQGKSPGNKALRLFGSGASKSWTVAILSDLKEMAQEIQRGRLKWILSTAMPLRDDFELFLDGDRIESSKLDQVRVGSWILGKDLTELPQPAPDDGEVSFDSHATGTSKHGLSFPKLGRVTGYLELFHDPIDIGKSAEVARSNGFFIYAHGRLVNVDDPGFGIDRNKLRHGTFSRFRLVLHADALDKELRSSRESLRAGPLTNVARNVAHGAFNFARAALEKAEDAKARGSQVAQRVAASSASLTRRPIAAVLEAAFRGDYTPRSVIVPAGLAPKERKNLLEAIRADEQAPDQVKALITSSLLVDSLTPDQPVALFDVVTGALQINTRHPFVAFFLGDFEDKQRSLPLELLAVSEVILEAELCLSSLSADEISELLDRHDLLLRELARSTGRRNARLVAQALEDAASDQAKLEEELVAAFDSMGFNAVPVGGKGRQDGFAEAWLSAAADGTRRGYKVSLEAKSKEKPGAKVTAKSVGVSTVARHRRKANCDHAVVVGPDFPTIQGEKSALADEISDDRSKNPGKTITLVRVRDMARLVRLVPLKRLGLDRLRELFENCSLPEEAAAWIEALQSERRKQPPYKEILEAVHDEQKQQQEEVVEFGALRVALRKSHDLTLNKETLVEECRALARIVPEWVTVHPTSIEIRTRPDIVLQAVRAAIGEYPEKERNAKDLPK